MKKLLLTLMILLTGCASQVTNVKVPGIERSESLRVKDMRPEIEKQSEIFSLSISNDAYAIYRVAESAVAPPAIRILQHNLFEKLGTGAQAPEVKVMHLVIYQNRQSELRQSVIGAAIGGVLGSLAAGQATTDPTGVANSLVDSKAFESLASTEFKRALYTEQENPGRGSVYVIYIETEVQGKRVFTRGVAPIKAKADESPFAFALESSMKFHLSQYQ